MADVFGRIAGQVYIHCDNDREFRDALDKLLMNEIVVAADPKRRLLALEFGDDPEDDDDSADLTSVMHALDAAARLGSLISDKAGWAKAPRRGDPVAPD